MQQQVVAPHAQVGRGLPAPRRGIGLEPAPRSSRRSAATMSADRRRSGPGATPSPQSIEWATLPRSSLTWPKVKSRATRTKYRDSDERIMFMPIRSTVARCRSCSLVGRGLPVAARTKIRAFPDGNGRPTRLLQHHDRALRGDAPARPWWDGRSLRPVTHSWPRLGSEDLSAGRDLGREPARPFRAGGEGRVGAEPSASHCDLGHRRKRAEAERRRARSPVLYIAMELVSGETLRKAIEAKRLDLSGRSSTSCRSSTRWARPMRPA